jgi:hypothetical protein
MRCHRTMGGVGPSWYVEVGPYHGLWGIGRWWVQCNEGASHGPCLVINADQVDAMVRPWILWGRCYRVGIVKHDTCGRWHVYTGTRAWRCGEER